MVNDDPNIFQHGVFASIENKFKDSQLHVQELSSKIDFLSEFIDNRIGLMDKQLKQSAETLGGVNDFKEYIKGEMNSQSDKMMKGISNIFQNFDKINEDIVRLTVQLDSFRNSNKSYGMRMTEIEDRVKGFEEELEGEIQSFDGRLKEMKVELQINFKDMSFVKEEILRVEHF